MGFFRPGVCGLVLSVAALGQGFSNQSLTGKYYFRYVSVATDAVAHVIGGRSLIGVVTFDGAGHYSYTAQQVENAGGAAAQTGSGTYSVDPSSSVTISSLTGDSTSLNAHLCTEALIGATTEVNLYRFDLLVAIPAPAGHTSNASLTGSYWAAALEFPLTAGGGSVRNSFFQLQADGKGGFATIDVSGRSGTAAGKPGTEAVNGATYSLSGDGTGTAAFGTASNSALLSGSRIIYVSANGDIVLGGSTAAGAHDLLIGVRTGSGMAAANLGKLYWTAGLRLEPGDASDYAGSLYANGKGELGLTRRLHDLAVGAPITFTGANGYSVSANGAGQSLSISLGVSSSGDLFVGADLDPNDAGAFEIAIGARMPALQGTGVFLNPQGVQNAASAAPPGDPIAPGEFIALFGTDLAPATPADGQVAAPPYPASLNGVSVLIDNLPAPIYLAKSNQLDVLVPYAVAGPTARIVVNNNGKNSNTVTVPVAPTSPGIYSLDQSGNGPAAVLHSDYTPITADLPARRQETILVFLTGLGAVNPAVPDGTAGGANPLSRAIAPVTVLVGGKEAPVEYAGLAPGFPGLYQLNITIPEDVPPTGKVPLAISTPDAFHDQVDLWID